MSYIKKTSFFFVLLCLVATGGFAQSQPSKDYFEGRWSVLIKGTPSGDVRMIFLLENRSGSITGVVQDTTGSEISKISSVKLTDISATIYFNAQGYDVDLVMSKKDEDHVTGSLVGMFDAEGKRVNGAQFSRPSMPQVIRHDTTSYIQTVDIESGKIDTVLIIKGVYEAPNWHPDKYLVVNFRGKIYRLNLTDKQLIEINTGSVSQIMDDHGISPDGKWFAITSFDPSAISPLPYKFSIYIVPASGGQPKKITSNPLSFWHGWSPDGKTIAYCGEGNGNLDVYTIPAEGGVAKKLTDTEGLDDGPDYSPDGKYIYFHSYRTGRMQIWRMSTDGSHPEQMTFDENANWFPHPSPNNKWIAYIAYTTDEKQNHPFGKNVKLCLINRKTKVVKDITPVFYGGAGTINVPSWSPDSRKVAFVSYSVK